MLINVYINHFKHRLLNTSWMLTVIKEHQLKWKTKQKPKACKPRGKLLLIYLIYFRVGVNYTVFKVFCIIQSSMFFVLINCVKFSLYISYPTNILNKFSWQNNCILMLFQCWSNVVFFIILRHYNFLPPLINKWIFTFLKEN